MIAETVRVDVANALRRAERERIPIPPLTATWPGLDVADAYAIQLLGIDERRRGGARLRGHKVGLTSRAMQQMFGVMEPDYGCLLDDMFVLEGGAVEAAAFCAPRIEPEVAFVLAQPLRGPGVTVADVVRATACIMPALELVDSRITDWRITIADTIADNASSARVILGGAATSLVGVDVRTLGCVLRRNGEVMETGAAGAALGNPVTVVAWLANTLAHFGEGLEAGEVVLPGACTRAIDMRPGDTVRADFDVLGHVSVNVT